MIHRQIDKVEQPHRILEPSQRLLSLDAFRGITMFLLIAEAALVYQALLGLFPEASIAHQFFLQFTHHPWHGLRFWDLIQPFFMFIVGVAMPFSLNRRLEYGNKKLVTIHVMRRCFLLFLFGTGLHCIYSGRLVFELWNVLTQLSFTILLTYLLLRKPFGVQLSVSITFLILTEILYRIYNPEAPFVKGENFGSYMDMVLMGKINGGGWVAINFIPTAAHTLWGAMVGNLLINKEKTSLIKPLFIAGLVGLLIGYGLDWSGVTPVIKRISTSSFVLISGGWAILSLLVCYILIDIKKRNKWIKPFVIVGMNSIFIYLFAEMLGHTWLFPTIKIFTEGLFVPLGISASLLNLITALLTLSLMWLICRFLYRRNIFIKI
jgi:predicted acyltransferase